MQRERGFSQFSGLAALCDGALRLLQLKIKRGVPVASVVPSRATVAACPLRCSPVRHQRARAERGVSTARLQSAALRGLCNEGCQER
jgi:hypothetical protein